MNGLCYTADKVMRLKQRLNGVLTALKWCLKRHTHPRGVRHSHERLMILYRKFQKQKRNYVDQKKYFGVYF